LALGANASSSSSAPNVLANRAFGVITARVNTARVSPITTRRIIVSARRVARCRVARPRGERSAWALARVHDARDMPFCALNAAFGLAVGVFGGAVALAAKNGASGSSAMARDARRRDDRARAIAAEKVRRARTDARVTSRRGVGWV